MNIPTQPWLKHYDPGVPASLVPYPDIPLFAFLQKSAASYPKRACTVFMGRATNYQETERSSSKIAAALCAAGLKKGDRVGLILPNLPQFVSCFYGILKAGGVIVPGNPLYTSEELAYQIKDARPKMIIALSSVYPQLKAIQSGTSLQKIILTSPAEALPIHLRWLFRLFREKREGYRVTLQAGDAWLKDFLKVSNSGATTMPELRGEDLAMILYTGGTTGLPKGAQITHQNLVANTLQLRAWLNHIQDGKEVTLAALPFFHSYGLMVGLSLSICGAATLIVIPDPRDLTSLLKNAHHYRATALPGVPTLFRAIADHPLARTGRYDLSSLHLCVSGGAALSKEVKEAFEQLSGGPLIEGYGMTETSTVTHANPLQGENRVGSIGLPLPDVDCRVISMEDGATETPVGVIGELAIASPQVFRGYWNREEESVEVLRRLPGDERTWLFSGDIGWMDADGYFYLVERKKEMIKASGFQVLPSEVELVIATHPKVKQVCVAGVGDAYRGETVKAWIVVKPGQQASVEEIRAYCETRLAAYKVPRRYEFRESLPVNLLGKVLRRQLVQEDREQPNPGDMP